MSTDYCSFNCIQIKRCINMLLKHLQTFLEQVVLNLSGARISPQDSWEKNVFTKTCIKNVFTKQNQNCGRKNDVEKTCARKNVWDRARRSVGEILYSRRFGLCCQR